MTRVERRQGKGIDAGGHLITLGTKEERCQRADDHLILVIPANAGTQSVHRRTPHWVPAFARMTMVGLGWSGLIQSPAHEHRRAMVQDYRRRIGDDVPQIGRASCRERVCQYV